MSLKSREGKCASILMLRVCNYYSVKDPILDDIEAAEFETYPELFNFWSYVAVSHILKDEAARMLQETKVNISEVDINEHNFHEVAGYFISNPSKKIKSSLDFYRLGIRVSILAILFKLKGCDSAIALCPPYIEKLVEFAYEDGYVDPHYDECRNFGVEMVDKVFKLLKLDVSRYSNLLRMLVFDPELRICDYDEIINKLVAENKFLLDSWKEELPQMSEKLFAKKFIRFLKEYRQQPACEDTFFALLVKTALLSAHSVKAEYALSVYQAAEYITTTCVLAKRKNVVKI